MLSVLFVVKLYLPLRKTPISTVRYTGVVLLLATKYSLSAGIENVRTFSGLGS